MQALTKRQLRHITRNMRTEFMGQMRKDVGYLLKPKPWFLPFSTWIWLLSSLLHLDNKSIKNICSTSSLTASKN